jgi:polyferredoxin
MWKWLDIPLRGLKYLLLGFFTYAVLTMSVSDISAFLRSPYGLIADVKMLNFFRFMGGTAAAVVVLLFALSFLYQNFWCRYLCPYGALMGFASLLSPLRITRNESTCIDCAKCAKACPSSLPVDKLIQIRSAECTGCMECVAVCPAKGALQMATVTKKPVRIWAMAAGVAVIFFGVVGYAKISGHWTTDIPQDVYMRLVPHADQATHPMPGRPE